MKMILLTALLLSVTAPVGAQNTVTKYTLGLWAPGTVVAGTQTPPLVVLDITVPTAGLLCGQAQPATWPIPTTDYDLTQPIPAATLWFGEPGFPPAPPPSTVCSYPVTVWLNTVRTDAKLAPPGAYVMGVRATSASGLNGPWEGGLPNFTRPVSATAPGAPRFPRIVKP
jgi:hypothetical protein